MNRMRPEERKVDMLATVYLAKEGRKPGEIADLLGITPVAVSRHLKLARKELYLRNEIVFVQENVSADEMMKVRQRVTRQALENRLNELAYSHGTMRKLSLRIFPCGPCRDDQERMRKLGADAALLVRQLLLRSKSCGVTWGGMLKGVVDGLRGLHIPGRWAGQEDIQCIPLSGEPLGEERASFSSSSLAHDLGTILNGDQYDAPSLAMVPAFIPDRFFKHEKEGVWRLIKLVKSYKKIFGPRTNGAAASSAGTGGMAQRLGMLLTSVGSHEKPLGFGIGVLFKEMKISSSLLRSLIVAEVGGVLIPRDDLSRAQRKLLDTVQSSWTGLGLRDLEECARQGSDPFSGPPGVVVVSGGKDRAVVVCELVKRGLINHLIIDEVLAEELEKASCSKPSN